MFLPYLRPLPVPNFGETIAEYNNIDDNVSDSTPKTLIKTNDN